MTRSEILTGILLLVLFAITGIVNADQNTTANVTTTTTTEAPLNEITTPTTTAEPGGGSVYFETYPPGATIWLDNESIGTSPFTYFTRETGVHAVRIWKKGYENSTTTVTVTEGRMERFYARLAEAPRITFTEPPPEAPIVTVRTVLITTKTTAPVPTPWATTESPVDPAVIFGALAIGTGIAMFRRR